MKNKKTKQNNTDNTDNTDKRESHPCIHCGWAMGEREGEPLCNHCKKKETK